MGDMIMTHWNTWAFFVQLNKSSLIRQLQVPIRCVITLTRDLSNLIRHVVPLTSHIRSYPPHYSHLHPPSLFFHVQHSDIIAVYNAESSISIAPCHDRELTQNTVIYWVQYTPKTICLPFILMSTSWLQILVWVSGVLVYMIDSHQPACHMSTNVKSPFHIPTFGSQLPDKYILLTHRAIHRPPPSTRPILLDHSLQVRMIMASKCMSKLTPSRSWSASLSWFHHGLKVYLEISPNTASRCISILTQSWLWSVSLNSLNHSFQAHVKLLSSSTSSQPGYTLSG